VKVAEIMRREARHVSPAADLATAGRLMGEVGCGVLPVVGEAGGVEGIVTDRDICLELARSDRRPSSLAVRDAMRHPIHACAEGDDLLRALATMAMFRVRRLPVLAVDGQLRGILSLDDIAQVAIEGGARFERETLHSEVIRTLAAICEHPMPAPTL